MRESARSFLHSDFQASFDRLSSVQHVESARQGVLLHHRVCQGSQNWQVITRRLIEVLLPEADNDWSYETAIFPEHKDDQPDLKQGHFTRYRTEAAAIAGHRHAIQRLIR